MHKGIRPVGAQAQRPKKTGQLWTRPLQNFQGYQVGYFYNCFITQIENKNAAHMRVSKRGGKRSTECQYMISGKYLFKKMVKDW